MGILIKMRAHMLRKKQVTYPTARPSKNDYSKAEKILIEKKIDCEKDKIILREIIAYLLKYKSLVFEYKTKEKNEHLEKWSRVFATAPWMANIDNNYYVESIKYLVDNSVLGIREENNEKINKIFLFINGETEDYQYVDFQKMHNEKIFDRVCSIIDAKGKYDYLTLKLATFHGRSYTDMNRNNNLIRLMREHPNLHIQILCVGEHSGNVAQENADRYHLRQAIKPGMMKLYSMAFWKRRQFKIRIVRNDIVDASLRCTILMHENQIDFCEFDVMRTGYERGTQGRIYKAEGKASIALQLNRLFDQAFSRAVPAQKNLEWAMYWFRRAGVIIITVAIVAALSYIPQSLSLTKLNIQESSIGTLFLTSLITVIVQKIGNLIKHKYIE